MDKIIYVRHLCTVIRESAYIEAYVQAYIATSTDDSEKDVLGDILLGLAKNPIDLTSMAKKLYYNKENLCERMINNLHTSIVIHRLGSSTEVSHELLKSFMGDPMTPEAAQLYNMMTNGPPLYDTVKYVYNEEPFRKFSEIMRFADELVKAIP